MAEALVLRPVTIKDAELLFTWRNDPQTRAASHNQDQINYDAHLEWLEKSLLDANRKLYLAEDEQTPVGIVRADWQKGAYHLSWTVAPESRGRGIGKKMVSLFVQELNSPICAEVKTGNLASQRIARFVGMNLQYIKNGVMYFSSLAK